MILTFKSSKWRGERGCAHFAKQKKEHERHITYGWTQKKTTGMASITLNSEAILLVDATGILGDVFEQMWATILHEMCVSVQHLKELLGLHLCSSTPLIIVVARISYRCFG